MKDSIITATYGALLLAAGMFTGGVLGYAQRAHENDVSQTAIKHHAELALHNNGNNDELSCTMVAMRVAHPVDEAWFTTCLREAKGMSAS